MMSPPRNFLGLGSLGTFAFSCAGVFTLLLTLVMYKQGSPQVWAVGSVVATFVEASLALSSILLPKDFDLKPLVLAALAGREADLRYVYSADLLQKKGLEIVGNRLTHQGKDDDAL